MVKYKVYVRCNTEYRIYVTAKDEDEAQKIINNVKSDFTKPLISDNHKPKNVEKIVESEDYNIQVEELKIDKEF